MFLFIVKSTSHLWRKEAVIEISVTQAPRPLTPKHVWKKHYLTSVLATDIVLGGIVLKFSRTAQWFTVCKYKWVATAAT